MQVHVIKNTSVTGGRIAIVACSICISGTKNKYFELTARGAQTPELELLANNCPVYSMFNSFDS